MQMISSIARMKKSLLIVVGLLVAAYVLTQQVCEDRTIQINAELTEESSESNDKEQKEPVVQMLALQMLPVVSVELEPFETFFIRAIFVETEENLPFIVAVPLEDTGHFKTLFRQI